MTAPRPWQRLRSQSVLTNRWLTVRQETVALPSGVQVDDYFLVDLPDVALVMPVTPQNRVVFVQQYRHGAKQVMLELPAGTFDPEGEPAATAALRELKEETGYLGTGVETLGIVYDNPVKCAYQTHLFLARDVVSGGDPVWDVTEEIEIVLMTLEEVRDAIAAGAIAVSGSIAALHLGLQRL